MKVFAVVLFCLVAAVSCDYCYKAADESCTAEVQKNELTKDCTAKYGYAEGYLSRLHDYANMHISRSFQYLLMSSHFGNYQRAREGFEKLHRKLSDTAWEDAIDIMKYVTLRGGKMELVPYYESDNIEKQNLFHDAVFEMTEFESLARALDIQKKLAVDAHEIYKQANIHDPEMGAYVEDRFMHRHAKTVRELSGYVNDLKRLITVEGSSKAGVQVFLFDEYLQKHL